MSSTSTTQPITAAPTPVVPSITTAAPSLESTAQFIHSHYSKLTYLDLYSGTVIQFILLTLVVVGLFFFMQAMAKRAEIEQDWNNQRCNPAYIPFAGWITHPDDKTAFEYTNENFQYCLQNQLKGVAATATAPLQYMLGGLTDMGEQMSQSMNSTRQFLASMRHNIQNFTEDVLERALNVMMPLQKAMIAFKDTLQKTQGVMTSALYTMLGSYFALQSLMGAILEMIVKMLIALLVIIIGLWSVPFTWPAAASMSAVFLGISIPLTIIAVFMTEVLHVKSSPIPKLRCFDGDTLFSMEDGTLRKIKDIRAGEKLMNGNMVTATMAVSSEHLHMYNLNGVVVSGNHKVSYCARWLSARCHPEAVKLDRYPHPVVYCMNTATKTLECGGKVWLDWDEVHGEMLRKVLKKCAVYLDTPLQSLPNTRTIHAYLDGGFSADTNVKLKSGKWVPISSVRIGDEVWQGGRVYGKVEVETSRMMRNHEQIERMKSGSGSDKGGAAPPASVLHHLLTTDCHFTVQTWNEESQCHERHLVKDYNNLIDKHLY